MDIRSLKQLVRQGEGEQLEFKLKTNHPDKIVREIVAFANTSGGKLLIGISDDRQIKGLKRSYEDEYELNLAIDRYCYPSIPYRMERIAVQPDLDVLAYSIPKSPDRPHFVEDGTGQKKAYFRVGEKSIQASTELCEILSRSGSETDVRFTYGELEHCLMQLLDKHESVTVDFFANECNISREKASEILILMVLANVVRIQPDELEDHFSMIHLPV